MNDNEEFKALVPQDTKEKIEKLLAELESYKEFTVKTETEAQNLNGIMVAYKGQMKKIDTLRKEAIKPYYPKYKYLNDVYNDVIKKVKHFVNNCDVALGKFERDQRIKRQAEQAKLDAIAAEKRRKEDEAARKEAEKISKYTEDGRTEMAEKAEARMEEHIEHAEITVAPVVEETKLENTHFQEKYTASVTDKKEAVEHCIQFPHLIEMVNLNLNGLERLQKASNGKLEIPGIKFEFQLKTRSRTQF